MDDDVTVLRDETAAYDDGTVASVRVLAVPQSETYPAGIKYKFHYGKAGAENPIIRFDNHHGPHEFHLGAQDFEIESPGLQMLYRTWRAALPPAKRVDWPLD